MKKRPFVLLEVLIAFSIVLVCIVPLLASHFNCYKQELNCLESIQRERLADLAFVQAMQLLQEDPSLLAKKEQQIFLKQDAIVFLGEDKKKHFKTAYLIKDSKEEESMIFQEIEIQLIAKQNIYRYPYSLVVCYEKKK